MQKLAGRAVRYLLAALLFDPAYYREQGGVRRGRLSGLREYLRHDPSSVYPNRWFATLDYLERRPDVAITGENPYLHFCGAGRREFPLPMTKRVALSRNRCLLGGWGPESDWLQDLQER